MADRHKNFAYSTVATAPSPASSGTSLVVASGQGILFPDPPFNATVWPTGVQPLSSNAEIVRVTDVDEDTFTIERQQEGTSARSIVVGDQIAATITAKTLTDAEGFLETYSPYILASGAASGLQTLNNATTNSGTGSLFMFPVTIPQNIQFNQILIANSISIATRNTGVSNTYISRFGIYSRDVNTFNLISQGSFSMLESIQGTTGLHTFSYPTTTHTSGYGYGIIDAMTNVNSGSGQAQKMSYLGSARVVGMQFGGNMTLTGGVYWIGILSNKTSGGDSRMGMSHMGIIGHVIQNINRPDAVSGLMRIGYANSQWSASSTHYTGWWGRHILGFVTATSLSEFLGTAIPAAVPLNYLEGTAANSTGSILPTLTFVST